MPVIVGPTSWQFINRFPLGEPAPGGGNTICISGGGTIWIVAPACSEVSRYWNSRNDAVTTATNCTSATGWFVPTVGQLQNPGYFRRIYWDSFSSTIYWSSSQGNNYFGFIFYFPTGTTSNNYSKSNTYCVRAFRCVSY